MTSFSSSVRTGAAKLQKYTWPFTFLVAIGGLWQPRLGLLVVPVMLALMVMSFFRGRFWCGTVCSHGSLFDHVLGPFSRKRNIPKFLKSPYMAWGFFAFFGYNFTKRVITAAKLWGTSQFWDRLGFIFVASYLMVLVVGGVLALLIRPAPGALLPNGHHGKIVLQTGPTLWVTQRTDLQVTVSDPDKCRPAAGVQKHVLWS